MPKAEKSNEGATARIVFPVEKAIFHPAEQCPLVLSGVNPADPDATPETKKLLMLLHHVSVSDGVLFGHQNAGHMGISIKRHDGTESDIKNICRSHPAVIGIDLLSFTGFEGSLGQMIELTKQVFSENVIITLSMHAPNFALGGDEFSDYSPNVTDPLIVTDLLPGGKLHAKYVHYLSLVVEFAQNIRDDNGQDIPVIFRPFHENNGSWFWWGADYCTPAEYRELFRYTIDFLRKDNDIHHFLYAYSPNGPFKDEDEYMSRYPGDDYIDVIGFDMYHDRPKPGDRWMDILRDTCRVVCSIARARGKIAAVTESGIRTLDPTSDGLEYEGLRPKGNTRPNWFLECLETIMSDSSAANIAYFLVWANFDDSQFWVPYTMNDREGHEMINEFAGFLNDPRTILASQIGQNLTTEE